MKVGACVQCTCFGRLHLCSFRCERSKEHCAFDRSLFQRTSRCLSDAAANTAQINALIAIAQAGYPTTKGLIVGNETLLVGAVSKAVLIQHIQTVKNATGLPVTTAEPWHIWLNDDNSDLVSAVDFILLHIHPYWEKIPVEQAAAFVADRWKQISEKYPQKTVMLGEVGWPTAGPAWGGAVPGESQQSEFLHSFLTWAASNVVTSFLFEAFDEAWKEEDGVGAHWGLSHTNRIMKMALRTWLEQATPVQSVAIHAATLTLSCRTFGGNPYSLMSTTNLLESNSWQAVTGFSGRTGAVLTEVDLPAPLEKARFYRLKADY